MILLRNNLDRKIKRKLSFDSYRKIAPAFFWVRDLGLRVRFFTYTRGRNGRALRGSLSNKGNAILSSVFFQSLPYLLCLLLVIFVPNAYLGDTQSVVNRPNTTLVTAFLGTMLAIAGVFLTLFYTSMLSAYSTKYPDGNELISKLFAISISEESSLKFCNAYVSTCIFALASLAFLNFSYIALIYMMLLSLLLISKIPSIVKLFARRTELDFISSSVGNKFLSAAAATSYEYNFHKSALLTNYLKQVASSSLSDLSKIMEFAIDHEKRNHGDASIVADLILLILFEYEKIKRLIPDESSWHLSKTIHKSWFESDSHEVSIAISTGTIPFPKTLPDPNGIEKMLFQANGLYRRHLIRIKDVQRYIRNTMHIDTVIEHSIEYGNIGWLLDAIPSYYRELLEFASDLPADSQDDLLAQSELLEAYAVSVISVPLGFMKLCMKINPDNFRYDSFSTFTRNELLRKGYPISNHNKTVKYCEGIKREIFASDNPITPGWCFDKTMSDVATSSLASAVSSFELLFEIYTENLLLFTSKKMKSVYVLVLKETELYCKLSKCLRTIENLGEEMGIKDVSWCKKAESKINDRHKEIQALYPKMIDSFERDRGLVKEAFPDIYGFAYFNYCTSVLQNIAEKNIEQIDSELSALYFIQVFASNDLREDILDKPYTNQYKAQVIFSPLGYFFELCGMAYAMSELIEKPTTQAEIIGWVSKHLAAYPDETQRWKAALDVHNDPLLGGKVSMDLFSWRQKFINAAQSAERYPGEYDTSFYNRKAEFDEEQKRLYKMFPSSFSGLGNFDGCKVFREFVFEPTINKLDIENELNNEK